MRIKSIVNVDNTTRVGVVSGFGNQTASDGEKIIIGHHNTKALLLINTKLSENVRRLTVKE